MESGPKLKLKFKINKHVNSIEKHIKLNKSKEILKLKLVRKDKNSPMLSIQKFIFSQLKSQKPISDLRKLWNKYEKQNCHSLIIHRHSLDYTIFREIVEIILETFNPYQIRLIPIRLHESRLVTTNDLIDHMI